MRTDVKGCSTCPAGQERYEFFNRYGWQYVQYDYRTNDGELFSIVVKGDLIMAQKRRDAWLLQRTRQAQDRVARK